MSVAAVEAFVRLDATLLQLLRQDHFHTAFNAWPA
jgi:hypothetical protein